MFIHSKKGDFHTRFPRNN